MCCAELLSCVRFFVTPWTVAHQAPLSMGILQATTLEWVAMPSSRRASQPRDQTQVSHIAGRLITVWANVAQLFPSLDASFLIFVCLICFYNIQEKIKGTLVWAEGDVYFCLLVDNSSLLYFRTDFDAKPED